MTTKSDRQKQLETILGHELDAATVQRLSIFWTPIASYVRFDSTEGSVTWQPVIEALPKQCNWPTPLLDVCGYAQTGDDGKIVFRLSQFVCLEGGYAAPVNVVATPQSSDPHFLTVEHSLVDGATDVEIMVSTWKADGAAAPNVVFDWRCRAVFWEIIPRTPVP